ncbi:MAG: hypothetical protein RL095_4020 [Verrucomicrobiota bacterium]|jgi:two-component system sensor histidine kinase CreC
MPSLPLGLRGRVFLSHALLYCLGLALFTNAIADAARRHYLEAGEDALVDNLVLFAALLGHEAEQSGRIPAEKWAVALRSPENPKAQIYEVLKSRGEAGLMLTDGQGRVLLDSSGTLKPGADASPWRNIALALKGEYGARSTRSDPEEPITSVMHVSLPIRAEGKIVGTVTLIKPVRSLQAFLDEARGRILQLALLSLGLVLLSAFLTARLIARPVERLTRHAAALRDGQRPPLPELGRGEIARLGDTLDELRRSLDGKEYVESYVLTLTHELKSPIAAIQGAAELASPDPSDPDSAKLLDNIRRESSRLAECVESLLLLARLENRSWAGEESSFDLSALCQESLGQWRQRLPERRFLLEAPPSLELRGLPFLFRIALDNLISNAVDFSPSDSPIRLVLTGDETHWSLALEDQGCGLPEFARDQVFSRFFSTPRPGTGRRSSGLGLAIVREIARLHHAEASLRPREGGGCVATLSRRVRPEIDPC